MTFKRPKLTSKCAYRDRVSEHQCLVCWVTDMKKHGSYNSRGECQRKNRSVKEKVA